MEAMILPSLGRYHALRTRSEASNRATQLAYAVQVFKNETGRYPASLSELPPALAGGGGPIRSRGRIFSTAWMRTGR